MIRIQLADGPEVIVQSDSPDVGYSVEPDALWVLNGGSSANYDVSLPEDVESIAIHVADTVVFRKRGTRIVSSPARDGAGRYVVDMADLSP